MLNNQTKRNPYKLDFKIDSEYDTVVPTWFVMNLYVPN